jgi:hypothetical protein
MGVDIRGRARKAQASGRPAPGTPAYLPVHPGIIRAASFVPFAIYARGEATGQATLLSEAGKLLCVNTWEQIRQAHPRIYVTEEDQPQCYDYVECHLHDIVADRSLPAGEAARWLYRVACNVMEGVFEDAASAGDWGRVSSVVDAIVEAVLRDPDLGWKMVARAPRNYSTPSHSVNVSILLALLATDACGVRDPFILRQVALGGILHDIGKVRIPEGVLLKAGRLTDAEFAQIKRHPRSGVRIGRDLLRDAAIARWIVWQHHEDAGGTGYPEGTGGEDIHPFARAAKVADAFDALTTRRPYGSAMSIADALATMGGEMGPKFDRDALQKFVRCLDGAPVSGVTAGASPAGEEERAEAGATRPAGKGTWSSAQRIDRDAALQARETEPALKGAAAASEATDGALAEERDPHTAMLMGIADALGQAVAEALGGRKEGDTAAEPGEADAVPAGVWGGDASTAGPGCDTEVEFARSLFPLIWQLDTARQRLGREERGSHQMAKLRNDALAYLDGVRNGLVRVLAEHDICVLEADDEPSAGSNTGGRPRARFVRNEGRFVELADPAAAPQRTWRRHAG